LRNLFYILVGESSAEMASGFGSDTDPFGDLDVHGSDEEWDLGFPRNSEVDEGAETSRNENADSDASGENCSYSDLHALHAHRGSGGGAVNAGGAGRVHAGRGGALRRGSGSRPVRFAAARRPAPAAGPTAETSLRQGLRRHGRGSQPSQPPPVEDITALGDCPEGYGDHASEQIFGNQGAGRHSSRGGKKNQLWREEHMTAALADFDSGMSMRGAAMTHGIPYSTFREWCYGVRKSRKKGPASVLSLGEEAQFVEYLLSMCERGLGLTPSALKMKDYEITKHRSTPFKNGIPGDGWLRWFRHRHPDLTLRVSQALEASRARGLCKENVQSFYDNLNELYT
jgi:hypothetical protein